MQGGGGGAMSETDHDYPIDRREAIRRVTALLGGVALVGGSSLVAACERAQRGGGAAGPILPETKTPGAKAAHVGAFMALMVTDTYEDREPQIFRAGMRQLQQASFMAAKPAERLALLERLDREQKVYMDGKADDAPAHYFRLMKELTLLGYFTSEIGCTQAQRYRERPGRFDPCVPYTPGETAWAGQA